MNQSYAEHSMPTVCQSVRLSAYAPQLQAHNNTIRAYNAVMAYFYPVLSPAMVEGVFHILLNSAPPDLRSAFSRATFIVLYLTTSGTLSEAIESVETALVKYELKIIITIIIRIIIDEREVAC